MELRHGLAGITASLGPKKHVARHAGALMPVNSNEPLTARACVGADVSSPLFDLNIAFRHPNTSGPLRRTIPRAAPPGAEAMAAIVSSRGNMEFRNLD